MVQWLITSGPTRASLDPFRILTNRSTGTFGTLLAEVLLKAGQKVTLVYGTGSKTPSSHPPLNPTSLKLIEVQTNSDLENTLRQELTQKHYDVVVHAAAVLDFEAKQVRLEKKKTKKGIWKLELVPTKKIIAEIKKWSPDSILVGFKLEFGLSESQLLEEGRTLQKQCNADFVVANTLTEGTDTTHKSYLLNVQGDVVGEAKGKEALVQLLLKKVSAQKRARHL